MNRDSFLTARDFVGQGRNLNMSIFTNLEKGMPMSEFQAKYSGHEIYSLENVQKISEEVRQKSESIEKSEGGLSREEILKTGAEFVGSLERVEVLTDDGVSTFFVKAKSENLSDDLEKGAISEALSYGSSLSQNAKIKKTGKEIKDKVSEISSKIKAQILTFDTRKQEIVLALGFPPTESLDSWDSRQLSPEIAVSIKRYPWNCCRFSNSTSEDYMPSENEGVCKTAASQESADLAREHNQLVSNCVSCYSDLEKIGVLERNLEDKTNYDLSISDLTALGF